MVASTEKKATKNLDIQGLSFEKASIELEDIVKKLESGNLDLEIAIQLYSRGNELRVHCEKILADAKLKVDNITQSNGSVEIKTQEV